MGVLNCKVGKRRTGGRDLVRVSSNQASLETRHQREESQLGALSPTSSSQAAGAWSLGRVSGGTPGVGRSVFWGLRSSGCWVPALTRLSLRAWRRILAVGGLPFQGQGNERGIPVLFH